MNNIQLQSYISKDYFMRRMFGGILYIDEIPKYTADKTLIYIYNSLRSSSKQSEIGHWTLILIHPREKDGVLFNNFFDSYGNRPQRTYRTYLNATGQEYITNLRRLQGPQMSCGEHVLYYYYHRLRGYSMQDILNTFTGSLLHNDVKVIQFYNDTK